MTDTYKNTLCLGTSSAYNIDEVVEWCTIEYGIGKFNYLTTNSANTFEFIFTSKRDMVRFGLTWNALTIRYRPRIHS